MTTDNDIKETIASEEDKHDDGKLTPEEQKFLDMLDEGRPAPLEYDDAPSHADSCLAGCFSEPIMRSILKMLLYSAFLVAVLLGVYYLFPKPRGLKKPIEQCQSIEELPADVLADKRFGEMMRYALEAYFKEDFTQCVAAIHPRLDEITAERDSNKNAEYALFLYIHSLRFANLSPAMRREAIEMLSRLSNEEPDNAAWRIALMRITYKDIIDYRQIFERSKTTITEWRDLVERCNEAIEITDAIEITQRQRIAAIEDDDLRPRLRSELADILAVQCSIYTSKWLLEGGEGKSSLPDDEGDRGVASRERAVRIAMDNDPDCGQFKESSPDLLDARNFIATTVKSQANGLFNSYYWNGIKYSRITPLQREINNTAAKLRKQRRTSGH